MKIAFVGKGGAGKTAISSLFARHLAALRLPVVAIDADINQHLAVALGMSEADAEKIPALGAHLVQIKEYLRGTNPRIASADAMTKTTPAGRGSQLLRMMGDDPFHRVYGRSFNGVKVMATGPFTEEDLGVACYHSKVGAVELYLNHLVDGAGEYAVVDMTAGADSFASGMFTRFDMTFLVVEPTRKGVAVYRQYRDYAADYDISLRVIGNKVQSPDDEAFLHEHIGVTLLTTVGDSRFIRLLDQGREPAFDTIEPATLAAMERIKQAVDETPKDWVRFQRQAALFHLRNAEAWANNRAGFDLREQIDPEFVMGPAALV